MVKSDVFCAYRTRVLRTVLRTRTAHGKRGEEGEEEEDEKTSGTQAWAHTNGASGKLK